MVDLARRGFFRGRPRPQAEIRPPWALAEAAFIDACSRCDDCRQACPQGIVVSGDGGYPTLNFTAGECTFCGDCVRACRSGAWHRDEGSPPWRLRAQIGPACLPQQGIECRICGEHCDARAIRFPPRLGGAALPQLDPAACTGCGACVAPCPVGAIFFDAAMR